MAATAVERLEDKSQGSELHFSKFALLVKRVVDITGAFLLLAILSPVIALCAIFIKLHDGGPVIHRRRVVGPQGEFDAFKLRSMRVDADDMLKNDPALRQEFEVNFKLKQDPRITPIGAFIRKTSVDELPQLWNVLRGQMSMVGPRMITPAELIKFGDAEWIFSVIKPGLTGYWQIQGRQEVTYNERVAMELHYVRNWSLLLDLKILLMTPLRVLRGSGAY